MSRVHWRRVALIVICMPVIVVAFDLVQAGLGGAGVARIAAVVAVGAVVAVVFFRDG